MSDGEDSMVTPSTTTEKRRGRKELPKLPCGCSGRTGQGRIDAMLMEDGSRVCREHGRRWNLTWTEVMNDA